MPIKAVLFDFGGVLSESGKKGFVRSILADLYDVRIEDLESDDLQASWRRNEVNEEQVLAVLNRFYGKHITKGMFDERAHQALVKSPRVYALAEQLRAAGIKTGILSNIFASTACELREKGFYDHFDPIVLSCDEGYAKPDEELYTIAVRRTGVAPEEILFIDDQEKCRPPAEEIGMHFLLATSPTQIVKETKSIIGEYNNLKL